MRHEHDPNVVQIRLTGTREMIDEVLKELRLTGFLFGRVTDFYAQRGGGYAVYVHLHRTPDKPPPGVAS